MNKIKRKSIGTNFSMCVQPAFIIGTNNEDGSHNFAPITWVSVTSDKGDDYMLVISMFGTKKNKAECTKNRQAQREFSQPGYIRAYGLFRHTPR